MHSFNMVRDHLMRMGVLRWFYNFQTYGVRIIENFSTSCHWKFNKNLHI